MDPFLETNEITPGSAGSCESGAFEKTPVAAAERPSK
jgi:hypothetical protein